MSAVIQNQISTVEHSADELLRVQHPQAMFCMSVQDLTQSASHLFSQICEAVEDWQERYKSEPDSSKATVAGQQAGWQKLFVNLHEVFVKVSSLIRSVEKMNHSIKGKRKFMQCYRELRGIVSFDLSRVAESVKQFERGEYTALGEPKDEPFGSAV